MPFVPQMPLFSYLARWGVSPRQAVSYTIILLDKEVAFLCRRSFAGPEFFFL
jgi:hypothetical protein